MSNKRGRPISENKRNLQYRIRLNDEERKELDILSKDLGIRKSYVIRFLIKQKYLELHKEL